MLHGTRISDEEAAGSEGVQLGGFCSPAFQCQGRAESPYQRGAIPEAYERYFTESFSILKFQGRTTI